MAEDVRIKVTLETQEAEGKLRRLKTNAKGTADALDGAGAGSSTRGQVPASRGLAGVQSRFSGGGAGSGGGISAKGLVGLAAAAVVLNKATGPAFAAAGRPGGTADEFGIGLVQGPVDLLRNVPIVGQAAGALFDRTVGTALSAREQAISATASATSGLAAAGIQVDQATLAQINAVHMEQAIRQVRNEAASRRAAPGVLDSILQLGLE